MRKSSVEDFCFWCGGGEVPNEGVRETGGPLVSVFFFFVVFMFRSSSEKKIEAPSLVLGGFFVGGFEAVIGALPSFLSWRPTRRI